MREEAGGGPGPARLPLKIDPAERERRVDLAAAHRLAALAWGDDALLGPFAARVPAAPDRFLATPAGLLFEEVTASSLALEETEPAEPEAEAGGIARRSGLAIAAAILAARPDVAAVLTTATVAGMAVSAMESGLLPIAQAGLEFHQRVATHDYEGLILRPAEASGLVRDLGTRDVMVLRNHGLLAVGRTVAEAWRRLDGLERACRLQVAALGSGQQLRLAYPALAEFTARQYEAEPAAERGRRLWQALLRRLDRIDAGYRG